MNYDIFEMERDFPDLNSFFLNQNAQQLKKGENKDELPFVVPEGLPNHKKRYREESNFFRYSNYVSNNSGVNKSDDMGKLPNSDELPFVDPSINNNNQQTNDNDSSVVRIHVNYDGIIN
ncbi:expressed protein [Dictyostelium purpureum]|uniref:Expressed protein n=1 Tax=Dictyostelium purpureum TaxID=5786 RepID=F0ZU95_DICPU|nr:uncharacterized protein DICPUDRAFT_92594 [Dictyostelium purpureum]EGC32487.1 expressed protein [Dictyostelium purpureum]|eukprot:XP_003290980.1 expressed protein [Dictyostelium purpureum]